MLNINSKEYWDSIYKREEKNEWRNYPKTFSKILAQIKEREYILELGCGQGILGKQIHDKNTFYTGIDISAEAVKQCKKKKLWVKQKNIEILVGMGAYTQREQNWIVATEFLEHTTDPDQIINWCSRQSKGLIIAVPNNTLDNSECKEHLHKFNPIELKRMLKKYFKKVEIQEYIDFIENKNIALPTILAIATNEEE